MEMLEQQGNTFNFNDLPQVSIWHGRTSRHMFIKVGYIQPTCHKGRSNGGHGLSGAAT